MRDVSNGKEETKSIYFNSIDFARILQTEI